jgi:hypothetical protein
VTPLDHWAGESTGAGPVHDPAAASAPVSRRAARATVPGGPGSPTPPGGPGGKTPRQAAPVSPGSLGGVSPSRTYHASPSQATPRDGAKGLEGGTVTAGGVTDSVRDAGAPLAGSAGLSGEEERAAQRDQWKRARSARSAELRGGRGRYRRAAARGTYRPGMARRKPPGGDAA